MRDPCKPIERPWQVQYWNDNRWQDVPRARYATKESALHQMMLDEAKTGAELRVVNVRRRKR